MWWGYCIYLPQRNRGLVVQMFPTKQDHMVLLHSLESKLCYQHRYLGLESMLQKLESHLKFKVLITVKRKGIY
jgi:hypothetical protein